MPLLKQLRIRYQTMQLKRCNNKCFRDIARVYDYFSQKIFHPSLYQFNESLSKLLSKQELVLDIGAGTGYFSEQLLLKHPGIELTAIEPCPDMFDILHNRLQDKAELFDGALHQFQDNLEHTNLFIFQRSLNHCLNPNLSLSSLCHIFKSITIPGGFIAIYEPPPRNEAEEYQYYSNKIKLYNLNPDQFEEYWPLYVSMLDNINNATLSKQYHYHSLQTIHDTFLENQFISYQNSIDDAHYCILQQPNDNDN